MLLELQFSLDTDDEQIADFLVGSKGHCKRMFESIENALIEKLPVSVKAVITPYNIITIPRFYRKLKQRGVNKIHLATYGRSGYYHTDDLFNHIESFDWLNRELDILRKEFPDDQITLQNGSPILEPTDEESRLRAWNDRIYCPAGHSSMMICSDGKVIPCEQMPEIDEYFCGDVNAQSILDIWNADKLKELTYGVDREKFKDTPCYDCDEREECHHVKGYCIRDLALFHNNIYQPPLNCYKYKLPFIRQN
jgi:radical SAM protein with 4Fe4S-binding SPASM domain